MSYRPGSKLSLKRVTLLITWTIFTCLVTGALMFLYTFGDCAGVMACQTFKNRTGGGIVGASFVLYWAVFIMLLRRWSRF